MVWKAYSSLLHAQAIWPQVSDLGGLQNIYFAYLQAAQEQIAWQCYYKYRLYVVEEQKPWTNKSIVNALSTCSTR